MDSSLILSALFFVIIVVPSLTVHEYAHARVATRLGDVTPRLQGRLTLNPGAHIDPIGTIAVPLVLSLMGAGVIGWAKPVPINPYAFHRPLRGEFLVAMAGPVSNILLGIVLAAVMAVIITQSDILLHTQSFGGLLWGLQAAVMTNFALAFFNLLPIPPLDGYRIITLIAPQTKTRILRNQQWIMYLFLLMMISPLGRHVGQVIVSVSGGMYRGIMTLLVGL